MVTKAFPCCQWGSRFIYWALDNIHAQYEPYIVWERAINS